MIQQSIQFCHACGSRAAPRALYCVDCGVRLAPTIRNARSPRPAGVLVGGRYRLCRLIDMGGNGAVYEAQHEQLGTIHALKESLANDQLSLEQFLSEARMMARLDHPVLVRVSDYFVEPSGTAFLVMDYVSGETLQYKLEQSVASYSVSDVISWLLQLCSVLEYLHDYRDPVTGQLRPVIHRDVKPLNIVVMADGRVKLLDLGIARFAVPGEATARIARAVTEPFAPIEQYGAGTDARSDLYALGVTAYVMLTRQLPPSALERATQPLDLRVRAINREVPPAVAAAIERAMMPRADARYPSVEAFRHAIESGWVAEDRLDGLAGTRGREASGLWGVLRRALVGPGEGPGLAGRTPPAPGAGFRLAERLVEWRSRADGNAALDITLALERGLQGPAQLRLHAQISQRGRRGKLSLQQIVLEEEDARAFAARLAELPRLSSRMAGELHFEVERTTLHGIWPSGRGPLTLTIRTSGPRGGLKACSISLDRRQVESLAAELQFGLRRVRAAP
ncbi:MAG: serine/threonine-protein kinase [Roseiflexaceae bacterium]